MYLVTLHHWKKILSFLGSSIFCSFTLLHWRNTTKYSRIQSNTVEYSGYKHLPEYKRWYFMQHTSFGCYLLCVRHLYNIKTRLWPLNRKVNWIWGVKNMFVQFACLHSCMFYASRPLVSAMYACLQILSVRLLCIPPANSLAPHQRQRKKCGIWQKFSTQRRNWLSRNLFCLFTESQPLWMRSSSYIHKM